MISILLIEDHLLVRESWKEVLNKIDDFNIVGESDTIEDAYEKAIQLNPTIILLDINLRGKTTVDLIKELCNRIAHPKIIVVSMHSELSFVKKMFSLGVKGYVTKYSPKFDLIESIFKVNQGETYFCSEVRKLFLQTKDENVKLSYKELETIKLVSRGLSNKEIATMWNVSIKAVEAHKTKIYKKLKLKSIADIIVYGRTRAMDL